MKRQRAQQQQAQVTKQCDAPKCNRRADVTGFCRPHREKLMEATELPATVPKGAKVLTTRLTEPAIEKLRKVGRGTRYEMTAPNRKGEGSAYLVGSRILEAISEADAKRYLT